MVTDRGRQPSRDRQPSDFHELRLGFTNPELVCALFGFAGCRHMCPEVPHVIHNGNGSTGAVPYGFFKPLTMGRLSGKEKLLSSAIFAPMSPR